MSSLSMLRTVDHETKAQTEVSPSHRLAAPQVGCKKTIKIVIKIRLEENYNEISIFESSGFLEHLRKVITTLSVCLQPSGTPNLYKLIVFIKRDYIN